LRQCGLLHKNIKNAKISHNLNEVKND